MPSLDQFAQAVLRLCIWLVLLTLLFVPLERWFGVRHTPRLRRDRLHDLVYYVISSLVPIVLLSAPMALLAVAAQQLVPAALTSALQALPVQYWPLELRCNTTSTRVTPEPASEAEPPMPPSAVSTAPLAGVLILTLGAVLSTLKSTAVRAETLPI